MGESITYKRPDGGELGAYYAEPAAGSAAPAVVVIQEWWGVNDQIKGVADRMAAEGYRALVPDLYRGKATLEGAEAAHLASALDQRDAASQDIRGAVTFLKQSSAKVGVVGFCMGGSLSILAAMHAPEVDAVSAWYGLPPASAGDVSAIRVPVQGQFALQDRYFTADQVRALETKLNEMKLENEFYFYEADHAFGNESGPAYNEEASNLAWQRTLEFFAKHLS